MADSENDPDFKWYVKRVWLSDSMKKKLERQDIGSGMLYPLSKEGAFSNVVGDVFVVFVSPWLVLT